MGFSLRCNQRFQTLAAAAVLLAAPALAQQMGVSHPETLNDSIAATPAAGDHYKPNHAVAAEAYTPSPAAYSAAVPATPALPPSTVLRTRDTAATTEDATTRPSAPFAGASGSDDSDPRTWSNGIVTEIPDTPNTLIDGTLFRARLQQTLSTRSTVSGAEFTAVLVEDVGHHGQVMLPAGSRIRGRVTDVHGGKRIGGPAALRLTPEIIELPDGRRFALSAQVAGLDDFSDSRVNSEGVLLARTNGKATAAEFGLAAAGGAAAGALLGAGVGALVGAGVGAGVTTAAWLKREHQEIIPAGTQIVFCLHRSLRVDEVALGR